jgi:transcription-repair coupling factor (superfamily II helicase)
MKWIQQKRGAVKLRPDQKLVVLRAWDGGEERVKGLRSLMRELVLLT